MPGLWGRSPLASGSEVMRYGVRWPAGVLLVLASLMLAVAPRPPLVRSASPGMPGPVLSQTNTDSPVRPAPVIYLTFDDGPHPVYTPQILELLAEYGARGTFFVVGSMVRHWPEAAQQIVEQGHSIQLHSWRHGNLTKFTHQEFLADTALAQAALGEVVNRRATCMRPPYGAVNTQVIGWAAELNLKTVMWDMTGADWLDISAEQIARRVVNNAGPGTVVLLHDGGGPRDRTVSALEVILGELTQKGFRFSAMCASLPINEPPPACWEFYAWPAPRPCSDDPLGAET